MAAGQGRGFPRYTRAASNSGRHPSLPRLTALLPSPYTEREKNKNMEYKGLYDFPFSLYLSEFQNMKK